MGDCRANPHQRLAVKSAANILQFRPNEDGAEFRKPLARNFCSRFLGLIIEIGDIVKSDRRRFVELIAGWPGDIRDHIVWLAFSDRAEPPKA